ncbi:MAG TPA: hypothetical protein VNX68_16045 [Nitrosopumilaceae archaeon]|nr:hypothetical protein [Nitrosopumilaceae archaeon]
MSDYAFIVGIFIILGSPCANTDWHILIGVMIMVLGPVIDKIMEG